MINISFNIMKNLLFFILVTIVLFGISSCDDYNSSVQNMPKGENEESNSQSISEDENDGLNPLKVDGFDVPIADPSKILIPSYEDVDKTSVLTGSNWRLSQIIKGGSPVLTNSDIDKMCYTLCFYTDNHLLFHTSRNLLYAAYKADKKTNLIRTVVFGGVGYALKERELIGVDFWQYMIDADNFELYESVLKIFFDKDSYLLLNRISDDVRNITHIDGARWVLTKYEDIETGQQYDIDWNKYDYNTQLLIWFTSDSLVFARSLGNDFTGSYVVNSTTIKFTSGRLTQVGEPDLGINFMNAILRENIFEVKNNELTFRNKKSILTFNPEKP